jgi:hypothetical protein
MGPPKQITALEDERHLERVPRCGPAPAAPAATLLVDG